MIVLRFLRTIFGWGWIMTDTMVSALIIGIQGEGEASERVVRSSERSRGMHSRAVIEN